MAAYAAVPPDDPFAVSKGLFDTLAGELAGAAASAVTASALEELLDERGREIMRQLLQDHYDLRAVREEQQARAHPAPVAGTDGVTRTRLETGHGRLLATLFGRVSVTRCAWRKPGTPNYSPADAALSLPAGRHSHTLAKLAALEAARGSFDGAHAAIIRRCGPVIGKRQVEESAVTAASDIPPSTPPRSRSRARRERCWSCPPTAKEYRCGPGRCAKPRRRPPARDPGHRRTWVVLVDGAEHQLDLIRAEAARRGVTIHIIIDIIHVIEYIWGAAWSFCEAGDPAAEDWVAVKALAVLAGDSDRAAAEIAAEADAAGLNGNRRAGADACVRYLGNKRDFLHYDQALEAGWPIATGVIEGACRHLIADRLSLSGPRWGLDGAEAVLTLRAVISNGDFEEYWRFHLACEHQRLYPGVKQGQYTLGA